MIKSSSLLPVFLLLSTVISQQQQTPFFPPPSTSSIELDPSSPHSALSIWSRNKKASFLHDLSENNAQDWILVMGNEGGDLDSMVAGITMSFYLNHLEVPKKAIALLQTEADALDLRPENKLSLMYAQMSNGHRDLLTIDELPIKPFDIYHRIAGLSLVDHNIPRSIWTNSTILSIIDHHEDSGIGLGTANPRIIEKAACCSSLVAELVLDELEKRREKERILSGLSVEEFKKKRKGKKGKKGGEGGEEGHGGELPTELVDLLLRAIAIDSSGLKGKVQDVDLRSAQRLWPLSSWGIKESEQDEGEGLGGKDGLYSVMKGLDKELSYYKKALDDLTLRDLLRRDWKADSIPTQSKTYPQITLGFASISASMNEMILRTPEQTTPEWFAIERAYTAEAQVDVSIVLNNHRDTDNSTKAREIALVVASGYGKRLNKKAADSLFKALCDAVESTDTLGELEIWKRPDGKELLARRKIWIHFSGEGRKTLKPILEKATREWRG